MRPVDEGDAKRCQRQRSRIHFSGSTVKVMSMTRVNNRFGVSGSLIELPTGQQRARGVNSLQLCSELGTDPLCACRSK
jgi:hypothetical protein